MTGEASTEWRVERDEATGAALGCPPDWSRIDAALGAVVLAGPQSRPDAFRPNLVLNVDTPATSAVVAAGLETYSTAVLHGLLTAIPGLHVAAVDVWPWPDGAPGRRITAAYRQAPHAVVLQQWVHLLDSVATSVSVSSTVAQAAYAAQVARAALTAFVPARPPEDLL